MSMPSDCKSYTTSRHTRRAQKWQCSLFGDEARARLCSALILSFAGCTVWSFQQDWMRWGSDISERDDNLCKIRTACAWLDRQWQCSDWIGTPAYKWELSHLLLREYRMLCFLAQYSQLGQHMWNRDDLMQMPELPMPYAFWIKGPQALR